MKRLLIFLICSVLAFGSLGYTAGAAGAGISDTAAQADTAVTAANADAAKTAATADEIAPTDFNIPTETAFLTKLNTLRSKYPNGSIWEGVYYEDGMAKAWTCFAYAVTMMREIFGVKYYAERIFEYMDYNFNGICAGDIVRIDGDSHSIFIIKVTSSGFYYTDGNGTGVYNQVRWDGFYSASEMRSRFTYKVHLPGNTLQGTGVIHNLYYNAGGGSGSMSSSQVGSNQSFTIKSNGFTRESNDFGGFTVKRNSDNKLYTTDGGWRTQSDITENGYHYKIYKPGESYTINNVWTGGAEGSLSFTFYAQWLPTYSTVEYMANYSGYNYLLGSDLGSGYSDYIYPRDSSNYTVTVDTANRLNNANSLKIVGKAAGNSSSDLSFLTSTNKGYGNGYSPAGTVGDEKTFTLRFYAKSSVDGAKLYIRWGYSSSFQSVALSRSWKSYSVILPKNRYFSHGLHPYFDKAGTYYINSPVLSDNSGVSNIVPESGAYAASEQKVRRGEALYSMPSPTRGGYVFSGWFTSAEGGSRVDPETPIKASTIRLYAHWRKDIAYKPVKEIKYNGHIYELYDNALGWQEAEQFCSVIGGHLVSIGDKAENDLVLSMINDRQGYCWLGLHCTDKMYSWAWPDSTPYPGYSNWFSDDYAAKDTDEDYAMMYPMSFGGKNPGEWDKCVGSSYYCSYYSYYNSFYICEFDDPAIRGDANGDKLVDALDATVIQRDNAGLYCGCPENILMRGDVDDDGVLDLIDVTFIQRYAARLEIPYEIDNRIKI